MSKELQEILTQAVEDVKARYGRPVLARIAEITPFTVRQLQRLRDNGFVVKDNGNKGRHKSETKMARFLCMVDDEYLKQGITNSSVILQIAIGNGHLCHVQRPANDMISGQPGTYYAAKFL